MGLVTEQHDIRLYGLRHGQSEANEQGIIVSDPSVGAKEFGLTEVGREQIRQTATETTLSRDTVILCSPFLRTTVTAQLFAAQIGAEAPQTDDRLAERYFGDLEGLLDGHYARVWTQDRRDARHTQWQVESVASVWQRFEALWTECTQCHRDRAIVLVTHGDVLSIGACGLHTVDLCQHHEGFAFETAELRLLCLPCV